MELVNKSGLKHHLRAPEEVKSLLNTIVLLPSYIGAPRFESIDNQFERERSVISIANFIMKRFPKITAEQLVDAFEMAAAGELTEEGKMINPATFGKLINIEVIGRVLRAYAEWHRMKRIAPAKADFTKKALPEASRGPEAQYHELRNYVIENRKLPELRFWKVIHNYLVEKGLSNPIQEVKESEEMNVFEIMIEGRNATARINAIKSHFINEGILKK